MMKDDKFFWFKENRIVIPGVKGEHVFMHLTDSHIDVVDELSTPEEREKYDYQHELWAKYKKVFADKNNEPYGEPQMIPMLEAFEKALALAEELQPEALLMSGDILDNMHPAGERYLVKRMAEYPGPFLCVPGNHEDPALPGVWETGVRPLECEGFRIVGVDDSRLTVSAEDLASLKALCDEGIPIIILCHAPFATSYCKEEMSSWDPYFYFGEEAEDENARAFIELCKTNDMIKAVICGHVHGYHALEFVPGKPMIVGSQGHAGAVDIVTVAGE